MGGQTSRHLLTVIQGVPMPDYTLCVNTNCRDAKTCCRFLGRPDRDRQSYINPEEPSSKECLLYWNVEEEAPFELMKYTEAVEMYSKNRIKWF